MGNESGESLQRPEGRLIATAQRLRRITTAEAAAAAGIGVARWRELVRGHCVPVKGLRIPVTAPADRLARMAAATGVTACELAEAGRADAAALLAQAAGAVRGS
jgi:hypothetical protein